MINEPATVSDTTSARLVAILVYGLLLLALCNGITALIAVVLAYVARSDARGTIYASHLTNAITVFWVSLVMWALVVMLVLQAFAGVLLLAIPPLAHALLQHVVGLVMLMPIAGFAALVFFVWYLYRTIKGLVRALNEKPYG
jgi:uncharacterized membrane protein